MKERGIHKAWARKTSDYLVLPICHDHHVGENGLDRIGISEWEDRYGTQASMLDYLCQMIGTDLWELARQDAEDSRLTRKYKRSKKLLPRQ